jgi:hypothetical protein
MEIFFLPFSGIAVRRLDDSTAPAAGEFAELTPRTRRSTIVTLILKLMAFLTRCFSR